MTIKTMELKTLCNVTRHNVCISRNVFYRRVNSICHREVSKSLRKITLPTVKTARRQSHNIFYTVNWVIKERLFTNSLPWQTYVHHWPSALPCGLALYLAHRYIYSFIIGSFQFCLNLLLYLVLGLLSNLCEVWRSRKPLSLRDSNLFTLNLISLFSLLLDTS